MRSTACAVTYMKQCRSRLVLNLLSVVLLLFAAVKLHADERSLRVLSPRGYLPGIPVLVRVEVRNPNGSRDTEVWDGEATLTANAGVTLSTNRVVLRNGIGSALVTFTGGGDFDLTTTVGALQSVKQLQSRAGAPQTTVTGTA